MVSRRIPRVIYLASVFLGFVLFLWALIINSSLKRMGTDLVNDVWLGSSADKVQQEMIEELSDQADCAMQGVLRTGSFCLDISNVFFGGNSLFDIKVCGALEDLFGNSTVGDLGAGLGHYGRCFLRLSENLIQTRNVKQAIRMKREFETKMRNVGLSLKPQVIRSWEGFDGALNIEKVSGKRIRHLDLSKPQDIGRRYDWVMSLEVGEHIPKEHENIFIDNLVRHACTGVVLSWAVPGQRGFNHINTRTNEYIIEKMTMRGLTHDKSAEDEIRNVAEFSWFGNTVMVFRFPHKKC